MRLLLLLISITFTFISNAQTDIGKLQVSKPLKKGFYRNYKEFLDNNPTKFCEFKSFPIYVAKADSTIVGIDYKLNDTVLFIRHVWGYCDGIDVYVNNSLKNDICSYWKLEAIGKYSYYYMKDKNIPFNIPVLLLPFGFVSKAASAAISISSSIAFIDNTAVRLTTKKTLILKLIDEKGKSENETAFDLRDQLEPYPDLLNSFNQDMDSMHKTISENPKIYTSQIVVAMKNQLIEDYLLKLNEMAKQNK